MSRFKSIILIIGTVLGLGLACAPSVGAVDVFNDACKGDAATTALCKDKDKDKAPSFVKSLVNILLFVLGAVSVIVIIFAGIFYTTSIGDQQLITKAKNTLLYAVVGLIVALASYAIVNFVLTTFI